LGWIMYVSSMFLFFFIFINWSIHLSWWICFYTY
jgi:hypothetical protein